MSSVPFCSRLLGMVSCCEGLGGLLSDSRPHIYLHNVHTNPNDGDGDNPSDEPDDILMIPTEVR